MKILIVGPAMGLPIPTVGWGGIEKVIWKHTCELRKRGHEVDVLNDRGPARIEVFQNWRSYDVIHVHQEWCFNELKASNVPFIFTSHMSSWQRNWDSVGRYLSECTMAMPFEKMANWLPGAYKSDAIRFWPIWNGADQELFKPGVKEPGMCVAVGKDEPRKKFNEVIEMVNRESDKFLVLVGPGNEKYRGKDNVQVIPNSPEEEIAKLLGRCELFYHLADEEADCLVVKEAGMAGCQLCLSPYCEAVYFQEPIPDRWMMSLPQAKFKLRDPRALALERYTWEKVVDNLEEGYRWYLKLRS